MTETPVPNARIRTSERPTLVYNRTTEHYERTGPMETVYIVEDEQGEWGTFDRYEYAKDRLKTRKTVEKAMKTRRENKARQQRIEEMRRNG